MFIGAQNDDFKNLSLHQLGHDRNRSSLIEWVSLVISSSEQGNYSSFANEFLVIDHLIIHVKHYKHMH